MSSNDDFKTEETVREAFRKARGAMPRSPAFLETRVMATLRERRRGSRSLFAWRALASSAAAVVVALAVFSLQKGRDGASFQAQAGEALVVRVDVQPLSEAVIATAEIDLPEGVEFYSRSRPELSERRNLVMAWNPGMGRGGRFPFAIRAFGPGERVVYVRFRDAEGALVLERKLSIQFKEGANG